MSSPYKGFTSVELRRPTRSTFDLSHEKRLSTRIGKLTPVFISETMPNDTFYGHTEFIVKLAPMIAPVMHRLTAYIHYFFIPNRLLWEDWEDFITGGRLGGAVTTPPVPPRYVVNTVLSQNEDYFDIRSLADYLGVPPIPDSDAASWNNGETIDAMPFAAFYKLWYDYFRDRNYVADNDILPLASGAQAGAVLGFLSSQYRCWSHDYFTSALPFTQRGAEVLIPMEGEGIISYLPTSNVIATSTGNPVNTDQMLGTTAGQAGQLRYKDTVGSAGSTARLENLDEVTFENTSVSVNDLRRAVALQQWLERNALAGSRYNESIMAHFGRRTSDARLQRAEYLGGGKAVIQIGDVFTTAYSEDADTNVVPPANPSGRGSVFSNTNKFSYNCEEHGFIIGVLSVLPTTGYMQGLPRMFQERNTFLDYPWPSFAHLGEQEVYQYEVYMQASNMVATGHTLFGYQSRYADWKHISSSAHGDFRTSLDYWHLTREFSEAPTLGQAFVTYNDDNQDRIFNVSGVDTLWIYLYNNVKVKRSLPYFGTPMLR